MFNKVILRHLRDFIVIELVIGDGHVLIVDDIWSEKQRSTVVQRSSRIEVRVTKGWSRPLLYAKERKC